MRRRHPADYSSDDSEQSDTESCFSVEDEESDPDTNPTDVDSNVERDHEDSLSFKTKSKM